MTLSKKKEQRGQNREERRFPWDYATPELKELIGDVFWEEFHTRNTGIFVQGVPLPGIVRKGVVDWAKKIGIIAKKKSDMGHDSWAIVLPRMDEYDKFVQMVKAIETIRDREEWAVRKAEKREEMEDARSKMLWEGLKSFPQAGSSQER